MIGTGSLPYARLAGVAAALALGAACTNSGLGGQTPTTGVPATGQPTGGGSPGTDCAYVGTWEVVEAKCGTFDINDDWFAIYPTTTMEISDSGAGDGSCDVVFSWSNASCSEVETWEFTAFSGGEVSVKFDGIDTCEPASCTFFGSDASCVEGDRQQGGTQSYGFESLSGSSFGTVGLLEWGYPQCTLDLAAEWSKQ